VNNVIFPGAGDYNFYPPGGIINESHVKASRTLFIGDLDETITRKKLEVIFGKYGSIVVSFFS
jgi:RNA recognition motif-containing protein